MSIAAELVRKCTREELFLQRYDQLLKWASQLTKRDSELARDLVQDSFLQFWLSNGSLLSINNIDSYLYRVLKNTYLTHLRRSPGRFHVEFDDLETLGPLVDPFDQFRAKDELIAICRQLCIRKETSVAASLLILRYFHGYLPSEIAKLTRRTRNVVDGQLKLARCEVTSSSNRESSRKTTVNRSARISETTAERMDLVDLLRREIFAAKTGQCLDSEDLKRLQTSSRPVPRNTMSHLVSCFRCLDAANKMLGLPTLKERDVFDAAGRAKGSDRPASKWPTVIQSLWLIGFGSLWDIFIPFDSLF